MSKISILDNLDEAAKGRYSEAKAISYHIERQFELMTQEMPELNGLFDELLTSHKSTTRRTAILTIMEVLAVMRNEND